MDDVKRENNKIKRSRSDVKNVVSGYLHKRNYTYSQTFESTKNHQITHSLLESGVGRSNSILYSCYNSDPIVIDHNFTKFLIWLKDQTKHKNRCYDVEQIVGPLFCHLYVDILRGGHSERAASFFKCHLPAIDKNKCDSTIKELINLFAADGDSSKLKEKFRSKKESNNKESVVKKEKEMLLVDHPKDPKFQELLGVIKSLQKRPMPIYNIKINNNKRPVSCGLLVRQCGLVAFAENNIMHLMPVHCLDSLFNVGVNNEQIQLIDHFAQIYSIAISPDNNILVSVAADHNICIYSLTSVSLLRKCTGHLGPVYCVKISSNGEYIATGSMDATARLWDIKTGRTLRVFAGHTQSVTCLDFHPNCLYVATGSADRNIRLWSLSKATPLRLFHAAKGTVYALAFNPSGRLLASASEDKKIRVWDLLNSKIVVELKCKDSPAIRLIWSKDGKELCAGTIDGLIRVWDFAAIQSHSDNSKYHEPVLTQSLNGKLLNIEYAFGHYGTLTV